MSNLINNTVDTDKLLGLLVQIDETMRMIGGNMSAGVLQAVEALNKGNATVEKTESTGATVALSLNSEQTKKMSELKTEILATADKITQAYKKEIEEAENSISQNISENYVATSDFGTYQENINTTLEQTNENIKAEAEKTESIQNELTEYKKTNNASLAVQAEDIISEVSEKFVTKTDLEDFETVFSSKLTQNSSNVVEEYSEKYTALNERVDENANDTSVFIEEINAYIKRGLLEEREDGNIYGIELGKSDSNIKARIANNKLSFIQGGVEVAYISDSILFITRAEFLDYIKIGNSSQGYFTFDVTENGLEVKYIG